MDTRIVNKRTGSEIFFKGIQTSRKDYTAALKGLSNCTTFILDEAEELHDEDLWDKIDDTFRTKTHQLRLILCLNPTTREHWIYGRFFEGNQWKEGTCGSKNGITYIHTTFMDNIDNIEESKLDKWIESEKTRPDYYKSTILGGWRDAAEGVIFDYHYGDEYDMVEGQWTIGDYEHHGETLWGLDFGSNDPTVLVECNLNKKTNTLYARTHFYLSGMVEDDIYRKTKEIPNIGMIAADNRDKMHIEGLRRKGLNIVPCKKGADSVMKGMSILLGHKIVIDPMSQSAIREARNYKWSDSRADYPNDKEGYDHFFDALRYAVFYNTTQKSGTLDSIYL